MFPGVVIPSRGLELKCHGSAECSLNKSFVVSSSLVPSANLIYLLSASWTDSCGNLLTSYIF